MRTKAIIVMLILLVTACGSADGEAEVRETDSAAGSPDSMVDSAAVGYEEVALDVVVTADRKVISRANLDLVADDTRAAYDRIVALVEERGGFVLSAVVGRVDNEDSQPSIELVVRVPSDRLQATLDAIKDTAEVLAETRSADDVTEQFVDLEARLTNLRALEEELRALLTEVRQNQDADPDKLLRVFAEISSIRGQIEQIEGQMQLLSDRVELATIGLSLEPTAAAVPIVDETWRPLEVARDALRGLAAGLQSAGSFVINLVLYVIPMALLWVGIPGLLTFIVWRRWGSDKEAPASNDPTPTSA